MNFEYLSDQLRRIGLSEKQAKTYLAILFLGASSVQKIAQQAKLNRPTVYDILEELIQLGLVSRSTEGAKTIFIAAPPNALQLMLDKQATVIAEKQDSLTKLLPELAYIERTTNSAAPVVRFVNGKEGIDVLWDYIYRKAKPGTEVLCMTNHDETLKVYPAHLTTNPKIRLKKKISSKQFVYDSQRKVQDSPELLRESTPLHEAIPGDITLYDDKAVLLSYGEKSGEWTGVVIENKSIVETLRHLFHLAWRSRG